MKASTEIYLDRRPQKNGKCNVKIKITHNRKRKHFKTDVDLTPEDFKKVMFNQRRTKEQRQIYNKLYHYLNKANTVLDKLEVFTFDKFREAYTDKRDVNKNVSYAFEKYIEELETENRISTASSYQCAINSLSNFKPGFEFADVTSKFLKKYEKWMLDNGHSVSTVGIYLRSLRTIFNCQSIDKNLYPFGRGSGKYTIPTSRNIKKALTIEEVGMIYAYEAEPGSSTEMARDYWMFLYLSNGMNVKDFCLLKWKNIDGDMLTYQRAKTKRSKRNGKQISVALKPQTQAIIKKWGIQSLSSDAYIFPHLTNEMTPEKQRQKIQDLTKLINKYVKRIAKKVGINKNVTTYYARHSFATVLKRSGANTAMISELLGHSNLSVTENYLDSFENEQIQKQTDVLTAGFDKAN